ncbi:MAG: choice-of-anchor D domain-containing protein [Nitrospirae bacterium]|nr:choice-of-anchor D domain-containing protein [Nitrospirota bacterium]
MKRMMTIVLLAFVGMVSVAFAEETGCLQTTDNWIIRAYSGGTASPNYTFTLAVIDPVSGQLVPHSDIKAFVGATTPCLNADRVTTHLCEIEANAQSPDISLACDAAAGTAYIVHDHAGQLTISTIPDLVKYAATNPVLQATPASLIFGRVAKGTKTLVVTVTNTGTAPLHISTVTTPAAPYSKPTDTCTGATVAPTTGSCSISIKFAPLTVASYPGSFTINSDGGTATIQLTGSK